ncbi:nuclease [Gordonia phage LittleFella]|nr:nuclease [Gordonia phage LittleFella]
MTVAELPFVRSSERGDFKKCPQSWYWRYVEWLVPSSAKLQGRDFGTAWHLAAAEYYIPEGSEGLDRPIEERRGRPMMETFDEWVRETRNWQTRNDKVARDFNAEEFEEEAEKIRHGIREHMAEYKGDPDWQVIAREETFAANIDGKAIDVGTIDLVVRVISTGEIWIVDHKTAKQAPNQAAYEMEDQGGSYCSIATTVLRHKGLIGPKERIKGIIFNFIMKKKPDERPRNEEGLYLNKNGTVSKVQPTSPLLRFDIRRTPKQQRHQLQRIVDDVTVMDAARKGVIPIIKAPGRLCPFCDFFALCKLDENRGDVEGMKDVMFKKLDPYHDHREGAENSKLSVKADKGLKHGSSA